MRSRLLVAPLLALALVSLAACASDAGGTSAGGTTASVAPSEAAADGACEYKTAAGAVREVTAPAAESALTGDVPAVISTSAGDLAVTLTADRTPCTVNSFASLAQQGYYDGTVCHRLTTSGLFVLQCGDPSGTGRGGPGSAYAEVLDGSYTYPAGTGAMANAGPDTNGSQFFLVYQDTPLPASYTVFGHMDEASTAIVAGIAAAGTDSGGGDGAPATPVDITAVTIG